MDRYIDAELYKEELRRRQNRPDAQHLSFYIGVQIAIDLVDRAPEVELAPVIHAHWIKRDNPNYSPFDGSFPLDLICSHCGLEHVVVSNFCPDCGAIMDEEVE